MIGALEQVRKDLRERNAPKMSAKLAQKLLEEYDGIHSMLYPILKNEIDSYRYSDHENPFPYEFLFFERDYLEYYLDILERKIPARQIIDIGCQNGFQSYIFEDFDYVGIDCVKHRWFRDKGNYIHKYFSDIDMDLSDCIAISNMSLGYFNKRDGISEKEIAEKLSCCRWLYIGTTPQLLKQLSASFEIVKYFKRGEFPRAFLENKTL